MLNISFNYRAVFSFRILHEYYTDETLTDFMILPSARSIEKARRLGLLIKQQDNRLTLLFEEEKQELLSMLPAEEFRFSFFIYSKNNYFYNFTQLPVQAPEGKILHFSNRAIAAGVSPTFLSKEEHIGIQDYLNISEIKEEFPAEHPTKKPIAYIEIDLPELLRQEIARNTDFNELPQQEYFIRFSARKTYWKYAIVSKYRKLETLAEIIPGDGSSVSFSRHENELLLNKQEASIFISNEPLILKQNSDYDLKLTQRDRVSKTTEIIPRLPVPSVEMIKPESREEDARIYSEVVIYI